MKKKLQSKRTCVIPKCENAVLKRVPHGHSIQTNNGFFTNATGETRLICPNCGAYYK